ncbi:MAG TPA: VanZ family protein [Longimicrobiaceae bacterium]|nr:VanZ family protein [Longimicrobiaceae bacterium]
MSEARGVQPTPADADRTRARLSAAVLVYCVGVILFITLVPFRFEDSPTRAVLFTGELRDVVANLALFLPIGFLYPLSRPGPARRRAVEVVLLSCVLSMTIETAQLFEHERYSSVLDVLTNTVGAAAGAAALEWVRARLARSTIFPGRLSLELPLMGLLYLLLPLLWLSALSAGTELPRMLLPVLVCCVGVRLWGVLYDHHFGPIAGVSPGTMRWIVAAWTLAGLAPALMVYPWTALTLPLLAAVAIRPAERASVSGERRFEAVALRAALPALLAYLVVLLALPLVGPRGAPTFHWGFPTSHFSVTPLQQLRFLQAFAAVGVLGYVLAEVRGRSELPFRRVVGALALAASLFALPFELVRAAVPGLGFSAAEALLLLAAGPYGGWIYHLQRAHVRASAPAAEPVRKPREAGLGGAPAGLPVLGGELV